jgi:hypothetical protein
MIDMLSTVKKEFPELYTKKGELRKTEPKRFVCKCGHAFNKTKSVRVGGIVFGVRACEKCGEKVKESPSYSIWKRMINNQIEQEDFILNEVIQNSNIEKDQLQELINNQFKTDDHALGHLVYFGYLQVDTEKRDTLNRIEYTVNPNKNLSARYERIQ